MYDDSSIIKNKIDLCENNILRKTVNVNFMKIGFLCILRRIV